MRAEIENLATVRSCSGPPQLPSLGFSVVSLSIPIGFRHMNYGGDFVILRVPEFRVQELYRRG